MKKTIITAMTLAAGMAASTANAALDQTTVDGIVSGISADAAIAIAAGFSILAIVLGARVGFGLVKGFISAGAS
ncbi:hypothetical protein [Vibrio cyclitrophicus]|uniref:hypothetical protein n=1 Tax=Vibrio cyclitrophicus TaxID=47951 RepID=UPI000314DF6E|nr:hypothetical protein [Vibrio cyclitrophicus]OEF29008.1 hypothetical protein OA9_10475 [Vibrio cyclitrophicus 1F97]